MEPRKVEISHRTIIFTVLLLVGLSLLWQIRSIIILFFIGFVLMEAINPLVTRLQKFKIPRIVSILIIYILIITVIAFVLGEIVPVLIEQTTALVNSLPDLIHNVNFFGITAAQLTSQLRILEGLPENVARATLVIFSNIFSTLIVLVLAFYMLLDRQNFGHYSSLFFGPSITQKALIILDRLEGSLGAWVRAEVILMTIIGLMAYVGYVALGLNFTVPLAIAAGILEVVPNIGPIISTALATVVGFSLSPLTGFLTLLWGIIIQQIENNIIVPKIMKETIGLHPLTTILIIAAGAELGGVIGAILAVPIFLTVKEIISVLL